MSILLTPLIKHSNVESIVVKLLLRQLGAIDHIEGCLDPSTVLHIAVMVDLEASVLGVDLLDSEEVLHGAQVNKFFAFVCSGQH